MQHTHDRLVLTGLLTSTWWCAWMDSCLQGATASSVGRRRGISIILICQSVADLVQLHKQ